MITALCRDVLQRSFIKQFSPGVASRPAQDKSGKKMTLGELWTAIWLQEFDDWFITDDKRLVAAQVSPPTQTAPR